MGRARSFVVLHPSKPPEEPPLESVSCDASPVINGMPCVDFAVECNRGIHAKRPLDQGADNVDWRTDKRPEHTSDDE